MPHSDARKQPGEAIVPDHGLIFSEFIMVVVTLTTTPGTCVVPLTTQRGTRVTAAPAAVHVLYGPRLMLVIWLTRATQPPAVQVWVLRQGLLQAPQWMVLVLVLVQTPLQQVSPAQQAGPPDAHVTVPTALQADGVSVGLGLGLGLALGDGLGLGLALGDGMGLAGVAVQTRAVHVWSTLQALLQAPQWLLSLVVFAHTAGCRTACSKLAWYRNLPGIGK
jgi:hypothetical protein